MIRYIAVDPGNNVGIAEFNIEGRFLRRDTIKKPYFFTYLKNRLGHPENIQAVICENFRMFPGMPHNMIMNTFDVVRVIGAVDYACFINGVELHLQEPNVRTVAEKWLGFNYKSHTPDDKAAHAHGVKWLVNNRILTVEQAIKDNEKYENSI